MTGTESIFTDWNGAEIMWHVSTMLPYLPADPKQLARKKHIGNDRCVIIFRDGDSPPVRPSLIASKQLRMSNIANIACYCYLHTYSRPSQRL